MKRILTIVLAMLVLQGCASNDPWTRQDTVMQAIYTGTLVVDAIQTADIQNHPEIVEVGSVANMVLGDNPSSNDTYTYFATLAVSNYLISRALPRKWRPYWQGANIGVHGRAIFNNCDIGLGSFCGD